MKLSSKEIAVLRKRWSNEQLAAIATAILSGNVRDLDVGTCLVDGVSYVDLRGIRLNEFIRSRKFDNVDFSYSQLIGIGGVEHSILNHCRLCGVDLNDNVIATTSTECDYSFVKFKAMSGQYVSCRFIGSNLSNVLAPRMKFINCDFTNANMYHTHLMGVLFDNCIWDGCKLGQGSFGGSKFVGTRPTDEQLGETIMDDVTFTEV